MSKLSKEQIQGLTQKSYLYSRVYLMCDGYKISLTEFRSQNSIRTVLYVNGVYDGKWLPPDADYPESKFYSFMKIRIKKNILKPKCRKMETKILDRRTLDFASVGQALRHINKVCDSVSIIEE